MINMGKGSIRTRQEACYYLGVREDSSIDEIKKAYHTLAKMYHPDINPRADVKDYYIKVCESYEYLMQYPVYCTQANNSNMYSNRQGNTMQRSSRIFQSNAQVREQYRKQKMLEAERKKKQERDIQERQKRAEARYEHSTVKQPKSKEEEVLDKIRAIWLAETIKRQIALDQEKKEAEQKRKLYQAFMQQKLQEEKEQDSH